MDGDLRDVGVIELNGKIIVRNTPLGRLLKGYEKGDLKEVYRSLDPGTASTLFNKLGRKYFKPAVEIEPATPK